MRTVFFGTVSPAELVAGNHVDADIAAAANQVVHDRAMQDLEPPAAVRLADDDLGDVVALGVVDHVVGDAPPGTWNRRRFASERFRKTQRIGDAIALFFAQLQAAAALDVEGRPRPMQAVGQALGITHQPGCPLILADADQDALAGGPRTRDRARLHLGEQLLVHPLGGAAQRQLAQRRQVGRREEVLQRALGLLAGRRLCLP